MFPTEGDGFAGARFALLTKHGKEASIEPVLRREFGASLEVVTGFDTDTLGTFTREVPRSGTQLETARRKAEIAVEMSGLPLGIGSEGAFGPGPFGLGSWNTELIVLVDTERQIEVVGRARAVGHHLFATVRTIEELTDFTERAAFPDHALVVRPDHADDPRSVKGLRDWSELSAAFSHSLRISESGVVWVESDLRAHMNPTRMQTIAAAAEDLGVRLQQCCPRCESPGFGVSGRVPGLPCGACGTPSREAVAELCECVQCGHQQQRAIATAASADPMWCDLCNP